MGAPNQAGLHDQLQSRWGRASILLCCSLIVLVGVYWSTVVAMTSLWRTSTFSHGALIIPISAYLIWLRSERIRSLIPTPTFNLVPVLALLAIGWFFGELTMAGVVQQLCLVAMVIALIGGVLGAAATRSLLMPLAFLFFAVPLGDSLVPKLQDFSAWFAVKMLDMSGIPVLLEGRVISVPWGKWEVAEACSGLRFLLSSVAAGFLFAGLMYRTWPRRVTFLFASAVVPILANGIRIYGIVLLGHLFGNRVAASVDHVLYGWIFFTMVILTLFTVGSLWRETPQGPIATFPHHSTGGVDRKHHKNWEFAGRGFTVATVSLIVLSLGPAAAMLIGGGPSEIKHSIVAAAPLAISPWTSIEGNPYNWSPNFPVPDAELMQSYERDHHSVTLSVAYYDGTLRHTKLVNSLNSPFDSRVWQRAAEDERTIIVRENKFRVHETFVRSTAHDLVIWNWYWIDGRFTDDELVAKLLLGKVRLQHEHELGAAIAIVTGYSLDQRQNTEVLEDFLNHVSLEQSLALAK